MLQGFITVSSGLKMSENSKTKTVWSSLSLLRCMAESNGISMHVPMVIHIGRGGGVNLHIIYIICTLRRNWNHCTPTFSENFERCFVHIDVIFKMILEFRKKNCSFSQYDDPHPLCKYTSRARKTSAVSRLHLPYDSLWWQTRTFIQLNIYLKRQLHLSPSLSVPRLNYPIRNWMNSCRFCFWDFSFFFLFFLHPICMSSI